MNITIENVSKAYNKKALALNNVSFEIPTGVYGLIGRNGAGKTTLLRIMATIMKSTGGRILFDGKSVDSNLKEYRSLLGYLPQNTKLMPQLNIIEFLEYMCVIKGITDKNEMRIEVERCLAIAGLQGERKKRLANYSGGMLRRAGIAQALIGNPKILIIDEPTTGLDPEERLYFLNLVSQIGREKNVILSTHIIHDVENICPNVCVLEKGNVKYAGSVDSLVGEIKDKVWECVIEPGEETEIKKQAIVTNVTYTYGQPTVRYVSEVSVHDGSVKVEGTLEDAYIASVGGVHR
ncbi:MAG: ATP-binding cassette domain-containing protein [Clostridia bacterium]|jgi:ABC-2 type transport system ATP-binding protein|nr:ATP-binding cassette domain-containing protein [Clostridia bacterium]